MNNDPSTMDIWFVARAPVSATFQVDELNSGAMIQKIRDPSSRRSFGLQRLLHHFRSRLAARLTVLLVAVAVVPMALVAYASYRGASDAIADLELKEVGQEAAIESSIILTYMRDFSSDLLTLGDSPALRVVIRAVDNGGVDPQTNESYEVALEELTGSFVGLVRNKLYYQRIAYLNEKEDEIARVDYRDGWIGVLSGTDRPRNRADAEYFVEERMLDSRQVFVSEPALNRVGGKIEEPFVPVVHLSTPINDDERRFRGAVVTTVSASSFLSELTIDRGQIFLVAQNGDYMLHSDPSRTFSSEFETDFHAEDDFAGLLIGLEALDSTSLTVLDENRGEAVGFRKVHFDPLRPERHWLLIRTLPVSDALASIQDLEKLILVVGIGLAVAVSILAVWIARRTTRPLIELTRTAQAIRRGDISELSVAIRESRLEDFEVRNFLHDQRVEIASSDEVGQLGAAFSAMIEAVRTALLELLEVQRKTADLERSNRDLEEFAYVASHDLQEPLRMVASYTQLLGKRYEGKLDRDADDFIGFATDGAKRMQLLINDLLAFSRAGSRGKPLEPTDLNDVLRQSTSNLVTAIEESSAEVTSDDLPTVYGDAGQLTQVFQTLLSNSIKFSEDVTPEIHVGAERQNGHWKISVRDNAIGIEPQYQDKIFQIFQRLHTKSEYGGTGIGLAICKKIIERHGGSIWLESGQPQGSKISFSFPESR